jgi:hypothetical protein
MNAGSQDDIEPGHDRPPWRQARRDLGTGKAYTLLHNMYIPRCLPGAIKDWLPDARLAQTLTAKTTKTWDGIAGTRTRIKMPITVHVWLLFSSRMTQPILKPRWRDHN